MWFPHDVLIVFSNCSGKSTLACSLSSELHSRGKLSYILDGDNLRHGLNKDLGFKPEDRTENIRRTGKLSPKTNCLRE
jgi:adenylylsulfate kinase